jgi:hypothetical protein
MDAKAVLYSVILLAGCQVHGSRFCLLGSAFSLQPSAYHPDGPGLEHLARYLRPIGHLNHLAHKRWENLKEILKKKANTDIPQPLFVIRPWRHY